MTIFKQDGFTLIDVSHVVSDGMVTYKGLPAPIICDYLSREASKSHYDEGTSFQIGVVSLCSNSGTYVDVPFHRYLDGDDLSQIALDKLANLEAVKIIIDPDNNKIEMSDLKDIDVKIKPFYFKPTEDRHWGSDQYFENHPFVTEEVANFLKQEGVKLVGIDSYNIDDVSGGSRPCHSVLLGGGIPICEHMTGLDQLPQDHFKFFAVPVKMKGMGTFPVRAFGLVSD
ncbi:MAG: cyclase family protein [Enterobacterales bacterium]|nr:cyclase family protein [Enterobacterales bacterium]